jgi:ketosteroid isomerase-like protein
MTLMKRKRAGLDEAMSVVTRFVNACNRHDADAVYACLHPDFDSIQPMFPNRNFRGADQVRRNWQAIFDAEPGFRLTVLRSAAVDDTVWLELHGAGQDAEVAGVFVMGIQGDRIRWARIYSGLVEPVPAGATPPATAAQAAAAPQRQPAAPGDGEVAEEALIAPVVDIEQSGRRRRGGWRSGEGDEAEAEAGEIDTETAETADAAAAPAAAPEPEPVPTPEADSEPVVTEMIGAGQSETQVVVEPEAEEAVHTESPAEATAAHDMLAEFETEPEPKTQPEPEEPQATSEEPPPGDQPKWRFGKRK